MNVEAVGDGWQIGCEDSASFGRDMTIADRPPRHGLGREFRALKSGLTSLREAGIPLFQPGRIVEGFRGIVQAPNETQHVFTILESMVGPLEARSLGHFMTSERGQALLQQRPDVVGVLSDRAALARLPEGSLGRTYLDFVERESITAEDLVDAQREGAVLVDAKEGGARFLTNYLRDTHDIWHAVLGYHGDVLGEIAVLAFSFAQVGNLGAGFLVALTSALGPFLPEDVPFREREFLRQRGAILDAYRRGLSARWFPSVDWLAILHRPLEEIRAELEVGPVPRYDQIRAAAQCPDEPPT